MPTENSVTSSTRIAIVTGGSRGFGRSTVLSLAKRPSEPAAHDSSSTTAFIHMRLAGGLGAALLQRIEMLGWARRLAKTRIVHFNEAGERSFRALLAG